MSELATQKAMYQIQKLSYSTMTNATSGFLILVPKKDLIFLNMNFEDAMKFIISVGAVGELK